jgi:hypothetical protein
MKFKTSGPLVVFCRLKGPSGKVRESTALIAPSYEHCMVLRKDAVQLGYPSVTYRPEDWQDTNPSEVTYLISTKGIETGTLIDLKEVSVGPLKAEGVKAVVTKADLPHSVPVSLFLGRSFLAHFRLEVDPGGGSFSLS